MNPVNAIYEASNGPLVFGQNDCCIAAANQLLDRFGIDLMRDYRGRYTTEIGFHRIVKKAGFASVAEAVSAHAKANGFISVDREKPQDFDLGLVEYWDANKNIAQLSPAIFHGGMWFIRGPYGVLALKHTASEVLRCQTQQP